MLVRRALHMEMDHNSGRLGELPGEHDCNCACFSIIPLLLLLHSQSTTSAKRQFHRSNDDISGCAGIELALLPVNHWIEGFRRRGLDDWRFHGNLFNPDCRRLAGDHLRRRPLRPGDDRLGVRRVDEIADDLWTGPESMRSAVFGHRERCCHI